MNPKNKPYLDRLNRVIDENRQLVLISTYNVLFINDLVDGLVIDTHSAMKSTGLFRQKPKQLFNVVLKARSTYERMVNSVLGPQTEYLADANEAYCEVVRHHVSVLTYTIKSELDKNHAPHTAFFAALETARVMCEIACRRVDYWMKQLARANADLVRLSSIDYLRLTELCAALNRFCNEMYTIHQHINLNENPQIKMAVGILLQKLENNTLTEQAALIDIDREAS